MICCSLQLASLADFFSRLQGFCSTSEVPLGERELFSQSFRRLLNALIDAPVGNPIAVNGSKWWAALLPPGESSLQHLLGAINDINKWWKEQLGGPVRPTDSKNPLGKNPFMQGFCRLKNVAVGGALQRLKVALSARQLSQLGWASWHSLSTGPGQVFVCLGEHQSR